MVPLVQRELRKGSLTFKVSKVPTPLNAIAAEHECDLIIDVQCNGSMLCGMLMDGGEESMWWQSLKWGIEGWKLIDRL